MKKTLGVMMAAVVAAVIGFAAAVATTAAVVVPSKAEAYEGVGVTLLRSADAGAYTITVCPGFNKTVDVLCSARWCYEVGGATPNSTTAAGKPTIVPNCYTQGDFLYDGGNSTTIFGEGIRPNPPARIQMGDRACLAIASPDNALDAGTPACTLYYYTGTYPNANP